jgi:hypothetical protein
VFAAAAVVAAAGLGAVAHFRKPPDLRSHALDAIPNGALLVATADLTALRASPVGAPFLREGREIPGVGKVREVCGFDPVDALTEVAIAIPAAGEAGEFGLVAAGPIDAEATLACAGKVIEARGGHAVTTVVGSFRTVRDASLATTGGEIAVRKGGPLLLGAGAYLRLMIDSADGRAPTIRSSVAHGLLGREVGEGAIRVTVVLTPEQRRTLAEELLAGGAPSSPAGSIRAGALGVTLGQTVGLHAVVSCDNASACGALATDLAAARDARAKDFAVRIVGFGAVLERITLEPRGELVHAKVDVPPEEAALLVDRLLALRGMRHPMPSPANDVDSKRSAPRPDEVIRADGGAASAPPSAPDRLAPGSAPVDAGVAADGGKPR